MSTSLAEWRAGRGGGGSRISADHTARVREEAALPANALSHGFCGDRVRSDDSASHSTYVSDLVSAIVRRSRWVWKWPWDALADDFQEALREPHCLT